MLSLFLALMKREWRLVMRRPGDVLIPLVFFLVVCSLFPLGVGADAALLSKMAPGVLWVSALLATMLSLSRLFEQDEQDGALEQVLFSDLPLSLWVLGKVLAHTFLTGLPLLLLAPILGLQFSLPTSSLGVLMLSLALGLPVLTLLGAIGAALVLGLRSAGVLLALLILPFYVPVLVFGAGAVQAVQAGLGAQAHLSVLAAFLLLALFFAPPATAAALRLALE
ncbi:heme exporter protein CcmB [Alcaligenes sp. 13f]|uniref:heme exporter protein CcmB n=1 Tax=Alcaligenes sp. 13f TaxID=2841924 RepID=UPI001CF6534C|nr:heme exporter protein CcmB [Alcaligenes sp. 13f]MCB4320835.1 heme exporter protein CcmB [Alcaligenes sp. 13f]